MKNECGSVRDQIQALMGYQYTTEHSGENVRIKMEILSIDARYKRDGDYCLLYFPLLNILWYRRINIS